MWNYYRILLVFIFLIFLGDLWNRVQFTLTEGELLFLRSSGVEVHITDSLSIIELQNKIVGLVEHEFTGKYPLSVLRTLEFREGYCYDRSFLLQKIFMSNGFETRPVFIFFQKNSQVHYYDFVTSKINSHNVFEFKYKDRWYVCPTNIMMGGFKSLDDYISDNPIVPASSKYIRYVFSRNGKFLSPSWIPDYYFM